MPNQRHALQSLPCPAGCKTLGLSRRAFVSSLPALAAARALFAAAGTSTTRIGICAFSCHQHWKAVQAKHPGVKFADAISFARYGRALGAEGVQVSLRSTDAAVAAQMRALVEHDGGYYEGDLRLPKEESDLAAFETGARLAREAGATVARGILMGGRRYEVCKTLDDFRAFQTQAAKTLAWLEPVLRRHQLKLAVENHKDHTAEELATLLRAISSEWIGALVDTGNNLALLEEPHATIEALAPFALSVHLKDMAVQLADDGFRLSEVPLGTGILDLPKIIATLQKANPGIAFNLEMATRDPLRVPCLTEAYFVTFPERKAAHLNAMMEWVKAHPARQQTPSVSGKPIAQILAEEETNNRDSLAWMKKQLRP